jgi:hypothetical protein
MATTALIVFIVLSSTNEVTGQRLIADEPVWEGLRRIAASGRELHKAGGESDQTPSVAEVGPGKGDNRRD